MTTSIKLIPVQTACFKVQPVGWELLGKFGYLDNRLPDDELLAAVHYFEEPGDYVVISWPFETDFDDVFKEKGLDCHFGLRSDATIALRREITIGA
jgi:hypothetical protein